MGKNAEKLRTAMVPAGNWYYVTVNTVSKVKEVSAHAKTKELARHFLLGDNLV